MRYKNKIKKNVHKLKKAFSVWLLENVQRVNGKLLQKRTVDKKNSQGISLSSQYSPYIVVGTGNMRQLEIQQCRSGHQSREIDKRISNM